MYFIDEKLEKLCEVLESWEGARYLHMGTTRGGVDCSKLIGLIFKELDILQDFDGETYYSKQWAVHGDEEILLKSLHEHLATQLKQGFDYDFLRYNDDLDLCNGDVICFAMYEKDLCNHTGIFIDGFLFHVIVGADACKTMFNRYWRNRARFIFRVKKC